MASNTSQRESGFAADVHNVAPDEARISPLADVHNSGKIDNHLRDDEVPVGREKEADTTRNDSLTTAVEERPSRTSSASSVSMEKVETAHKDDEGDSDEDRHISSVGDTVTHTFDKVKQTTRKLYIHHRHQRDISRQFTPGSILRHFPHRRSKSDKETAEGGPEAHTDDEVNPPPTTFWQNIRIMLTTFPYWNMAFWSGFCYSIGSALFIIDGAWSWVPQQWPKTEFEGQEKYGVPLLFFFGACLYQVGGVMAYLEAINDGSFAGAAMKRLLEGHQDIEKEFLDAKLHTFFGHIVPHHHHDDEEMEHQQSIDNTECQWDSLQKKEVDPAEVLAETKEHVDKRKTNEASERLESSEGSERRATKEEVDRRGGVDHGSHGQGEVREYLVWRWWPTWHGLSTYHIYEMGYIACTIQLFGVTLYGVTSVVILPGILSSLVWWQELWAYWIPQVVASCCFLLASFMFTFMAQDRWNQPEPHAVSWWIGIWAMVGSVGFLLCAIFGLYSNAHTWGEYQSSLSSMWGSFFYMTSGLFQWYEAINVNVGPVLAFPNNRTPVLLRQKK